MYWWVYTRPSTYLYRLFTHRKCYDVEYQGFIPQGQNSRPFTDKNMGKDFTHCTVFLHKSDLYSIQLQLQPLSYLLNLFAYIMFEWSLTLSEKKKLDRRLFVDSGRWISWHFFRCLHNTVFPYIQKFWSWYTFCVDKLCVEAYTWSVDLEKYVNIRKYK